MGEKENAYSIKMVGSKGATERMEGMVEISSEKMISLAEESGFSAAVIGSGELRFQFEFRKYCEENLCGNYNRNYACPPCCGTPEEMKAATEGFSGVLVLKSEARGINAMDETETRALKKAHNRKTAELVRKLKEEMNRTETLMIIAGPCSLCKECKLISKEPCAFSMERYSCLSAYCIDVNELCRAADLELSWASDQASFFSLFLWK